jgi:hypothetical protein
VRLSLWCALGWTAAGFRRSVCDVCHEANPELKSHLRSHTFTYSDDAETALVGCRHFFVSVRESHPVGSPVYAAFLSALRDFRRVSLPTRDDVDALHLTLQAAFAQDGVTSSRLRILTTVPRYDPSLLCEVEVALGAPLSSARPGTVQQIERTDLEIAEKYSILGEDVHT